MRVLKNYTDGSPVGTAVEYNGQGGRDNKGVRRHFRWILNGHENLEDKKDIVIQVTKKLMF